jgi:hypothetical protein
LKQRNNKIFHHTTPSFTSWKPEFINNVPLHLEGWAKMICLLGCSETIDNYVAIYP